MAGILVVISGPSGSGKSTIYRRFLKKNQDAFFSVSCTTRKPRKGEADGVDYFFVNDDKFNEIESNGGFIETTSIYGNRYGTPRDQIDSHLSLGRTIIVDVDVRGGDSFRRMYPDAVLVFIVSPSEKNTRERLERRSSSPEDIERRIEMGRDEMKAADRYDYLIVNHDIDEAVESLSAIIASEKHRISRNIELLDQIGR